MASHSLSAFRPSFSDKPKKRMQPLTKLCHPLEEQGLILDHQEGTKIHGYLIDIHLLAMLPI